jgi:hypothetical protein
MKERLAITVRRGFKAEARTMAKRRRRSISGLFEDLIEAEMKRIRASRRKPKP